MDAGLREIVPAYLKNRKTELPELAEFLARGDFDAVIKAGHNLTGSGGGYGFDKISELGRAVETAAAEKNLEKIKILLSELADYLENLEVVYE